MITTRIAVRLALGILCGLTLVLLPAAFSTAAPASAPSSYLRTWRPAPTNMTAQPFLLYGSVPSSEIAFVTIVFLIFLPSAIFSFVIRRWAEKRARDYL